MQAYLRSQQEAGENSGLGAGGMSVNRLLCLVAILLLAQAALAVETWEVRDLERPGQWTVYNRSADGAYLGLPLAAGDMNGDGRSDLVLTPMNADSGPGRERTRAGEAVIVLSSGEIGGQLDLALLDVNALPPEVTVIYGADELDLFGTQVKTADLDGDGYDDAIISAQNADGHGNGRSGSGEAVIIWGRADIGGRVIDLREPQPAGAVTAIYGAEDGDRLGIWVADGDFDADGTTDAIVGADQGDGPHEERTHAGETYVIYGGAALRARSSVDLAAPEIEVTVVYGIDPEDHSGATVRAGDVNGDGAAELLIGAGFSRISASADGDGGFSAHGFRGGDGPDNRRREAGEAYIVFGARGERPATIDLADPPSTAVLIYGAEAFDAWGEELFAGDFNGDGYAEVAVGALIADGPLNGRPNGGELMLISGGPDLPGSRIDLREPPPGTVHFFGTASSIAGDTAMLVDVDADGLDDLVLAAPNARVGGQPEVGTADVFFGTAEPLPAAIDLGDLPDDLSVLRVEGNDAGDMLAYSMSYGDVDADGLPDLIVNAMGGDGFGNALPEAGEAHVLSGAEVSRAAGRTVPSRTTTPTPDEEPTPTPTQRRCPGDCDGDGQVAIAELVAGVGIALGTEPVESCPALDVNGDRKVGIAELVAAVRRSLLGCV